MPIHDTEALFPPYLQMIEDLELLYDLEEEATAARYLKMMDRLGACA